MPGRVVVLSGLPGSGKTSIAKALKKNHGFLYFEGDVWSWAEDAVAQAEETPTPEMIAKARENTDKMEVITAMGAKFYAKVNAGQDGGDFDIAKRFYDMMCKDVMKIRDANPDKDLVFVHAIHHSKIRVHLAEILDADVIICLDVPHDILRKRNLTRLKDRAEAESQTLEEFVMAFPATNLPTEYEARLEQFTSPGVLQLESLADRETSTTHIIPVAAKDNPAAVEGKVFHLLGLGPPTGGQDELSKAVT